MTKTRPLHTAGFTFVEVIVAMALFVFVAYGMMDGFTTINRQTDQNKDKSFATQKVNQMLEELRSVPESNETVRDFTFYSDSNYGTLYNHVLTTNRDVDRQLKDPAHPLSDNAAKRYSRNVMIEDVQNDPYVKRATVKVYLHSTKQILAQGTSLLRSMRKTAVGETTYQVYFLALGNVPGWRGLPEAISQQLNGARKEIKNANLGISLSEIFVSHIAYGRDSYYRPYINLGVLSKDIPVNDARAYFYPGGISKDAGIHNNYIQNPQYPHIADNKVKDGRYPFNFNETPRGQGDSIADQYNHAVRYQDEVRLNAGSWDQAPSLRELIEGMNQNLSKFRNSIIYNLHGDILPMPPMRNYSDAAKDPYRPYARAVTHPENLEVANIGNAVKLRVYSYIATNTAAGLDDTLPDGTAVLPEMTVTLIHPGVTSAVMRGMLDNPGNIRRLAGNSGENYAWAPADMALGHFSLAQSTIPSQTTISGIDVPPENITVIRLFNSPLRHAQRGNQGLRADERLYGLEYIPCLVNEPNPGDGFTEGFYDLADNLNPNLPKNTARWTITIDGNILNQGVLTVETRIGKDPTTGVDINVDTPLRQPTNLSRTYAWVGVTAPVTERYQFMGDPRHMPYADVKAARGYNWYFGVNPNAAGYANFVNGSGVAINGLWDGRVNADVPRFMQVFRQGLLTSKSTFVNPNGRTASWISFGGEIGFGLDQHAVLEDGIPIKGFFWDSADNSVRDVDELSADAENDPDHDPDVTGLRLIARTDNSWFGRYWIGELYPDEQFETWKSYGNLPVGAGLFYRAPFNQPDLILNAGLPGGLLPNSRLLGYKGAPSLFNGGAGGNFIANLNDCDEPCRTPVADAPLTGMQNVMNLFSPVTPLKALYPFTLSENNPLYRPPEWNDPDYAAQRTVAATEETYYQTPDHDDHDSLALIRFSAGGETGRAVLGGFTGNNSNTSEPQILLASVMRSHFYSGRPGADGRHIEVPKVFMTAPLAGSSHVNQNSILLSWESKWTRWDDQPYTSDYPMNYVDAEPLNYTVVYSNDMGVSWKNIDDNSENNGGVYDPAHATDDLSIPAWDVSDSTLFPEGTYQVKVISVRQNQSLHNSSHYITLSIVRKQS